MSVEQVVLTLLSCRKIAFLHFELLSECPSWLVKRQVLHCSVLFPGIGLSEVFVDDEDGSLVANTYPP